MKLYNTATKQLEEVKPIQPPKVSVYSCGPTVYDYPHIGNWFTFIRYDVLVRALKASGFQPDWVMNITDVGHLTSDADEGEDKLEKGAKREGKSAWDIAKFYSDYFVQGLDRLNILRPSHLPKATDHIREQIDLIKTLEQKGYTYQISDGVYYDTSKFPDYGKMAHLDLAHLKEGARIAANPEKKNPVDFALWKFSPSGAKRDMEWDSPWGKGFPGWHLECSAMSIKYLGETLDIHAGGIDHIPVHHTNEIAQSEAATGKPFANIWVHMNHVTVDAEKIAKSTGNGITLEDIEAKGFSLEALRLLVLQSHYRTQAEFSWETLEAAQNRLKDLYAWADLRHQPNIDTMPSELDDLFGATRQSMQQDMANDLNAPAALISLGKLVSFMQQIPIPGVEGKYTDEILKFIDDLLGLKLDGRPDISDEQKQLLQERQKARLSEDWSKSDALRATLETQKLGIRDTSYGQQWYRL
ncbi:MAG: Cysteine-tRNA ligase [Candidatus Saccharibacteria bacterium]|nr:Cysteine-tRNA ligase [Candidatus Saccharibacteria bacterium]